MNNGYKPAVHPLLALVEAEEAIRYEELEALESFRKGTEEAPLIFRPSGFMVKASEDKTTMDFVASEESPDRMNDVIEVAGWKLANFRKNPVFLFAHNNRVPPVGRVPSVGPNEDKTQLLATVHWDMNDSFAAQLQDKYAHGFMKAVSVGFRPLKFHDSGNNDFGVVFTEQELLELSAVPVPAHPKALRKAFGVEEDEQQPETEEAQVNSMVEAAIRAALESLAMGGINELEEVRARLELIEQEQEKFKFLIVQSPKPALSETPEPDLDPDPEPIPALDIPEESVKLAESLFSLVASR